MRAIPSSRALACAPLLLSLAALAAPPAFGVTQLSVFVTAGATTPVDTDGGLDALTETGLSIAALSIDGSVAGASADALAVVGYGWARAATSTTALASPDHVANGGAQARFQDDLVISSPGLNGTPGTLIFRARVSGGITAHADTTSSPSTSADASWNVTYQVAAHPSTRLVEGSLFEGFGGPVQTGEVGGGTFESVPIGFTFGVPFPLSVALNVDAGAREGAVAHAQFSNTLEWDGLVAVLSGGQPVGAFEVTSGSGEDWAGPIAAPEPGASMLAIAAVATVAALRRRAGRIGCARR